MDVEERAPLRFSLAIVMVIAVAGHARAQEASRPASAQASAPTLCGQPIPPPAALPPANSPSVVYMLGLCFAAQGNVSVIEPETYLFYVHLRPSRPSQNEWIPYDEDVRGVILADFRRLWETSFLDDIRIEATDYVFANGVIGKVITYEMEERARIKLVQYDVGKVLDRTKIDETLRDRGVQLRLDSFLDENTINRTTRVLQELLTEKGFTDGEVTHTMTAVAGAPKLVNLTFHVNTGPKIAIRDVEFTGNTAFSDAALAHAMKENREEGLLSFATRRGTYKDAKFAEDAQNVEDYYRDRGFVRARVGQPQLRRLDASSRGDARWVQLRVPVTEGPQYRIGTITFEGNTVVDSQALRPLFRTKEGDIYSQRVFREGLNKARDLYGAAGYIEFTGVPDVRPRDDSAARPVVDVTIHFSEGDRYVIHRLAFTGNTFTRDNVIRREMALAEGGVFSTEALKYGIRRLNQLGYFKPLQGNDKDVAVEKAPGVEHALDVTLKVEEQNRNQVQFGAGVSQYEGLFGNVSFTTSNFLGRGESLTLTGQKGSRSAMYQLGITEPYMFSRPISAGIDLFSRKIDYLTGTSTVGYSEVRSGATFTIGRPVFRFSRIFLAYAYEVIDTAIGSDLLSSLDATASVGVPVFTYLDRGRHVESRLGPSFLYNTVDNPFAPRSGVKISLSAPFAGGVLGGTTNYVKPELETVVYLPHTRRTALGLRFNGGFMRTFGSTHTVPYYLRYFLGGENQIRGVDIRTVGPTTSQNRALGGDKFVLFNAEYYFDLFGPVRALLFHDAGQAFSETQRIDLTRLRTSSGAELRVIVPMLNVPFRLIYAWNVYRDAFQPGRTFKFAVGTTF